MDLEDLEEGWLWWGGGGINGMAFPHGVGSVWAQGAWEVNWKHGDTHGFDPNLHNAAGNAGNQRMMLYVNGGRGSSRS